MAKHILTERRLKRLRPGHAGKPYDVMDAAIPGFGVRVLASGRRTFVLIGRFPGGRNPTRRALGVHGVLSVHEARQKARTWLLLLEKGIDPRDEAERARREQMRQRENAFGRVAEDYIAHAVLGPDPARPKQRKGVALAREIRQEFIARSGWAERPITQITGQDVLGVIDQAVARGAPYQAHNLLGAIRRLFNWAIARQVYGLERSPCDRMRPREIIGPKALRTRTLNDRELCALWQACERLGYPYGPLFKFLALTGQRRSEVGEARWREFDLERELWIIPAERMKMDSPHVVPLSADARALLGTLPRYQTGDYLFSAQRGQLPVNGYSKAKRRLDALMREELRADGAEADPLAHFVLHDIRRTVRTRMSALPISSDVAELVIAHARPGLRRVYDQYSYLPEKRRALELWEAALRAILADAVPDQLSLPFSSIPRD